MTAPAEKSSLPLLLGLTGAVLAVVGVGWFYLENEPVAEPTEAAWTVKEPQVEVVEEPLPEAVPSEEEAPVEEAVATVEEEPAEDVNVDADLRKARLAAGADILVFPESESALFYYNRVMESNPEDAEVSAEFTAVLGNIEKTVAAHILAEEYDQAHRIATIVANYAPAHSLVSNTQEALDLRASGYIDEALELARAGDDAAADEAFGKAAALPGRNPQYLAAVRSSLGDIRTARAEAARDRQRRADLRAEEARLAWMNAVRRSVTDGHLLNPAGASAVDLLGESNNWTAERLQLTTEVRDAVIVAFEASLSDGDLAKSQDLLQAATDLGAETDVVDKMTASLEAGYIDAEEKRISTVSELVQTQRISPRYPNRALNRNLSGWVEVFFTVTPSGETTDIAVRNSEPGDVFDNAAIKAIERWEFEPYEYRGQIISKRVGTKLVFSLED